jgi:hypothetical protein
MGSSVARPNCSSRDLDRRLTSDFSSVLLFNASLVLERTSLMIIQKVLRPRLGPLTARMTTKLSFRLQLARVFCKAHSLSDEEAADQLLLVPYNRSHQLLGRLIFHLHERVTYGSRWKRALRDWPGHLELAWADPHRGRATGGAGFQAACLRRTAHRTWP